MDTLLMECDFYKTQGDIMSYHHKQRQLDAQYITNITVRISKDHSKACKGKETRMNFCNINSFVYDMDYDRFKWQKYVKVKQHFYCLLFHLLAFFLAL